MRPSVRVSSILAVLAALVVSSSAGCSTGHRPPESSSTAPDRSTSSPPSPPLAVPGPCVDPIDDTRARLGHDADPQGVKRASLDLDADGTPDSLISHESFCGTGGCAWYLYVVRGSCGHYVGEVFAVMPLAESGRHFGLVDLDLTVRNGCAGMARIEQKTHFDGTRYVADRMRTCRCPDDAEVRPSGDADDPDPDRFCEDWRDPSTPSPK